MWWRAAAAMADPTVVPSGSVFLRGSFDADGAPYVGRFVPTEQALLRWLGRAPEVRLVVTARERLGMPDEVVFALPPLGAREARDLFVRRAQAARGGFEPGAEDEAAIRELVSHLGGSPLAIESAASQVSLLSPGELLEGLVG